MNNAATAATTTETPTRDWTVATATLVFEDRGDDQHVTVTYSDGREPMRGMVYHSERDGAPSPDAWMDESFLAGANFGGPAEVLEAIETKGPADGSPMIIEIPSVYQAEELADGWCVRDTMTGARWWPSDEHQVQVRASDEPEQAILQLVHTHAGTAGDWHN